MKHCFASIRELLHWESDDGTLADLILVPLSQVLRAFLSLLVSRRQ
jgi:hypothetical protein